MRSGSVLIGLLWCMALLSIVVVGVLHASRIDLIVTKNYGDKIQAHYLALAGVEKAKALLYQNAKDRNRSAVNHTGALYKSQGDFRDVTLGRGKFRVFRNGRADEGGGVIYGVSDEESRLSLNFATAEQLGKIDGLTPDIAAAIIDWRDGDNTVTAGGAEAEYYTSLKPPYLPRNAAFPTVRELLMVRGVTRNLLFGEKAAAMASNGSMEENPGQPAAPAVPTDVRDTGWASILTVDSSVHNVSATGEARVNVQQADQNALAAIPGVSPDIANAIVSYRGRNQFQSIADLLNVTAAQNQNQNNFNANQPNGQQPQNNQPGNNGGPTVISEELFQSIADYVTIDSGEEQAGVVNINTASVPVLSCLPGVTPQIAQAIVNYRSSSGFFPSTGALLKVDGITRDIFKQLAPLITARSETFRILSEGEIASSHTRQRLEVIVRIGARDIDTVSYREDDL